MTYIPARVASGSDKQVQYNDGGTVLGSEAALAYDKSTNQLTPGDSQLIAEASNPATPAAGKIATFSSGKMAMTMPAWLNEDGTLNFVQTSFARRHIFEMYQWARGGAASTVDIAWRGGETFVGYGASTSQPARATTNVHTKIPGVHRVTGATTDSAQVGYHGGTLFALASYGWFFSCRFAVNATPTNLKMFMGMTAVIPSVGTDTPSTLLSGIGIGCDAAATTLKILSNDASGSAASVDLTATFPSRDTTTAFDVFFFLHPGGTVCDYFVVNLGTGDTASGSITNAADLPATTSFMVPIVWMSNGASAGSVAAQLDIARLYVECFDV
jgi:hypothetical protein